MGFCLFGNAVIGARHALEAHGLARVAIVDFDVHHGNGTQDLVWDDARILFASTHQMPLYPGTGAARRDAARTARSSTSPCRPAPAGTPSARPSRRGCCRRSTAHAPELILVSAGFDAHARDPLANLEPDRSRLRLGHRAALRARRHATPAGASSRLSRADMIWTRSPPASRRMCEVLMERGHG